MTENLLQGVSKFICLYIYELTYVYPYIYLSVVMQDIIQPNTTSNTIRMSDWSYKNEVKGRFISNIRTQKY